MKKYKVIFTLNHVDEEESVLKGDRGDVLILDSNNDYYNPFYTTIDSIISGFIKERICYSCNNIVLLHELTTENILNSIQELHDQEFQKSFKTISLDQLKKYFYPIEDWKIYEIEVKDNYYNKW